MVQTIQARDITLHDLETKFGLTLVENDQFFKWWEFQIPQISQTTDSSVRLVSII